MAKRASKIANQNLMRQLEQSKEDSKPEQTSHTDEFEELKKEQLSDKDGFSVMLPARDAEEQKEIVSYMRSKIDADGYINIEKLKEQKEVYKGISFKGLALTAALSILITAGAIYRTTIGNKISSVFYSAKSGITNTIGNLSRKGLELASGDSVAVIPKTESTSTDSTPDQELSDVVAKAMTPEDSTVQEDTSTSYDGDPDPSEGYQTPVKKDTLTSEKILKQYRASKGRDTDIVKQNRDKLSYWGVVKEYAKLINENHHKAAYNLRKAYGRKPTLNGEKWAAMLKEHEGKKDFDERILPNHTCKKEKLVGWKIHEDWAEEIEEKHRTNTRYKLWDK